MRCRKASSFMSMLPRRVTDSYDAFWLRGALTESEHSLTPRALTDYQGTQVILLQDLQ